MNKNIIYTIFAISFFINFLLIFKIYRDDKNSTSESTKPVFKFIDTQRQQFIDSNTQNNDAVLHFSDLKTQIESELEKFGAQKNTGLFLQDGQIGTWLGINEKSGFNPASLLKIPVMMAILKKVHLDEISLKDKLEITEEDLDKNAGTLYQKGPGYKMTVWDFIEEMILTSDNTAKNVLKRQLSDAELNSVFAHVGIPNPYTSADVLVSPRGYTRLFKSLYFSTYLPSKLSEKALGVSTDTKMENLLSAGVPYEIQVAHKYGERPNNISDCGIIYHPKNPYFLCIMIRDMEIAKAKELMVNLSKIVYNYYSSKKE